MTALGIAAAVLGGAVLLWLLVIVVIVRVSLYPPRIHQWVSPGFMGWPQETVYISTADGIKIHAWWTPGAKEETVVVCFHGYLANRSEFVPLLARWGATGASFLFVDHRGHGRSGGAKVTLGRDEAHDAAAALAWAREQRPEAKIIALGGSMGAVAAIRAMAQNPSLADALVVDAPYRTLHEASQNWWGFLAGGGLGALMRPATPLSGLLLGFDPKSVDMEADLRTLQSQSPKPVYLAYGEVDPIVPPASRAAVRAAAGDRVTYVEFPGATHGAGRLQDPALFVGGVLDFLRAHGLLSATPD